MVLFDHNREPVGAPPRLDLLQSFSDVTTEPAPEPGPDAEDAVAEKDPWLSLDQYSGLLQRLHDRHTIQILVSTEHVGVFSAYIVVRAATRTPARSLE